MRRNAQIGLYAAVLLSTFVVAVAVASLGSGRLQAIAAGYVLGVVVAAGGALAISR